MTVPTQVRPIRGIHELARAALVALPRGTRVALHRQMVDCSATPDARLHLGIATSQDDLEACFSLLHDAYVSSGFMRSHPSGLRVTPYHALPTTTTLFARYDNQIVGTLSIIREGLFGFQMQSAFDLTVVRAQYGRIAEISALAVHPQFRSTGGSILFPLMKFMYEYCTKYFDTRHLVIAVNPKHIEMYESLLLFQRLQAQVVASYDFVNGAPAVGATLDLLSAPGAYQAAYQGRRPQRNLHHYFTQVALPNVHFPERPYYTTNDPVMSPGLLDYFFNRRVQVFEGLDERRVRLLHAIYPEDAYRAVLPPHKTVSRQSPRLRRYRRYSLKCPARLTMAADGGPQVSLEVIDASMHGFLARADAQLPSRARAKVHIRLGVDRTTTEDAVVVRNVDAAGGPYYGFDIASPSRSWRQCIADLEARHAPPEAAAPVPDYAVSPDWHSQIV